MSIEIATEIEIDANHKTVWKVLIDFENHPTYNPFISNISGDRSDLIILSMV